ncbi:biotin transporter BioY [Mesobacterium pallidum]|uniref:biotin transporter BioY n=1 Tax=Mesobacterium pallidum TaxID=2872037 RepID=UPI001EE2ECCB|nr:biotin transporter BioY [Mesobacterium pallidum]
MERSLVMVALFAALIAALGLIPPVTLGFGVPITAQSMGVMLAGCVLGARRGGLAALLFIALVALGLPLLAGGRGGLGVFASPTVGFVVGFPIAAFVTGLVMERLRSVAVFPAALLSALVGGVLALYVPGVLGLAFVLGKSVPEAVLLVAAFIPGDIAKAVIASALTVMLAQARPESLLSRG